MKTIINISCFFFAIIIICYSCEIHDQVDVSIKRKAIVHLVYHYDNGTTETLDDVQSMRLFIYNKRTGSLYRDTTLLRNDCLTDTGAMQTYISRGEYAFVSWANVGERTSVATGTLNDASLAIADAGADCLMYGRCDTPVVKGDSLTFNIYLFKSVFKVNVRVFGLEKVDQPEEYYFAFKNRSALSIDNAPTGEIMRYRPKLTYANGQLSGSFYTPYFPVGDDFTLGIYRDVPDAPFSTLCQTTVRKFANYLQSDLGRDIEINVDITIDDSLITIVVTDWKGQIIQDIQLGA